MTSLAPVGTITGVKTAPEPPNPCVMLNVAGALYPAPESRTSTDVIAPPLTVMLPACACTALAPIGVLNSTVGKFMLL